MLPNNKEDLPKCIFLDQNMWSYFARTFYGEIQDSAWKKALEKFLESIDNNRVIYPLTLSHTIETHKIKNRWFRQKLAWFFVQTSRIIFALNSHIVTKLEIDNAVRKKINECLLTNKEQLLEITPIRNLLLGFGLPYIHGGTIIEGGDKEIQKDLEEIKEKMKENFNDLFMEPYYNVSLMVDSKFHIISVEQTKNLNEGAQRLQENRIRAINDLTDKSRMDNERVLFFIEGNSNKSIRESLSKIKIPYEIFHGLFNKRRHDYINFFNEVFVNYVVVKLYHGHGKNLSRNTEANDLIDVDSLSVAIPYYNGVFVEKYWGTIAKQVKLDKEFNTIIITDIQDFPIMLRDLQCI